MEINGKVKAGLATTAVAGVLVAGAVIPATAQDDPPTVQEEEQDEDLGARADAFAAALAEELGIDRARVDEALRNVRADLREQIRERRLTALEERLDAAVEDGDLSQEQADAILEAAEDGVLPMGPRHGPRFRPFDGPDQHDRPHDTKNGETEGSR